MISSMPCDGRARTLIAAAGMTEPCALGSILSGTMPRTMAPFNRSAEMRPRDRSARLCTLEIPPHTGRGEPKVKGMRSILAGDLQT